MDLLARVMEKVQQYGARGVVVVPDWPGSEIDSVMMQANNLVQLLGIRMVEFESPVWMESPTFRGWSGFGLRVYKIK